MLVIISDLHLTDESTANNVKREVFKEILKSRIMNNADDNKAKELRIVLLGDILDLVRTDYWLRKKITMENRPWGGKLDPETAMNNDFNKIETQFNEILDDVLNTKSCRALMKMLNDIAEDTGIYTKVSYVVGNHDRVLWNFNSLQDKIRMRLKKVTQNNANPDRVEFLQGLYAPEYGVKARHGHEWDEICHGWEFYNEVLNEDNPIKRFDPKVYKVMAIGEVATAELMAGLIHRIKNNNVCKNDKEFINRIKDLNNIRPMMDVFRWLDWYMKKNISEKYKNAIYSALKESIKSLLSSSLAKKWDDMTIDTIITGDLVDRLQLLDKVLAGSDYESIKSAMLKLLPVINIIKGSGDAFSEGAEKEWDWMNENDLKDIQYIVYGHTHVPKHEYFTGNVNGKVRMYINTGTYLPLIQRTKNRKGFADAYQMTMAFFYRKDEDRSGRGRNPEEPTMDLWNGIKRKKYV